MGLTHPHLPQARLLIRIYYEYRYDDILIRHHQVSGIRYSGWGAVVGIYYCCRSTYTSAPCSCLVLALHLVCESRGSSCLSFEFGLCTRHQQYQVPGIYHTTYDTTYHRTEHAIFHFWLVMYRIQYVMYVISGRLLCTLGYGSSTININRVLPPVRKTSGHSRVHTLSVNTYE